MLAPPRLRDHLGADQQRDLDADAREPDAGAADLRARRDVMVAGQLATAHAGPIVEDGEGGRRRVGGDRDRRGARVEGVGDDLGEDRLLGSTRVGVAQILEKVEQIDACLAQGVPLRLRGHVLARRHHRVSAFSIFAHVSLSPTARLKTGRPGAESRESTQK